MINRNGLNYLGFSSEDYERYCVHYDLKSYAINNKKKFIKGILNGTIIKNKDGSIYIKEGGKIIKL